MDYSNILKNEIHFAVFVTIDENGLPCTRVIDIMLADKTGIYFLPFRFSVTIAKLSKLDVEIFIRRYEGALVRILKGNSLQSFSLRLSARKHIKEQLFSRLKIAALS
mgnify:FL=1